MADTAELGFDMPLEKKKKKKPKTFDIDSVLSGGSSSAVVAEDAPAAVDDDEKEQVQAGGQSELLESLESFGLKKKKKTKKVLAEDNNEVEETKEDAGGDEMGLDFQKKKKKKTKKIQLDDQDDDKEGGGEDMIIGDDDDDSTETSSAPRAVSEKSWLNSDRDYTYDELLTRVFEIMHQKNPEMASGTKQKFVMRPPQVIRVGTKKTSFVNFMEISRMLHRHQKHLLDFLLSELGTSGSIDGNNQLIIKGKFQQKQIENVLRRYIKEYVTCHTCRSPNTILQKDSRIFFLQCEACGSRCSVASIKHGFQAVTSKRAAMRAKAT